MNFTPNIFRHNEISNVSPADVARLHRQIIVGNDEIIRLQAENQDLQAEIERLGQLHRDTMRMMSNAFLRHLFKTLCTVKEMYRQLPQAHLDLTMSDDSTLD